MYALVDCNNFYVSCERVFNPTLNGRPVIVLSNNDGCAVARSNEAKAIGIKMGDPLHQIKHLVKSHNIAVYSSNYQLYGDMSARVMSILADSFPEMEVYSIDEAFLKLDAFGRVNLNALALEARTRIIKWTGIPVSIGIAPTKTLAKIANHVAKKRTSSGVFDMSSPEEQYRILKDWDVEEIWGVARAYGRRLRELSIYTAWDLRNADARLIRKRFGVVGERIARELQGISCLDLEHIQPRKNIMTSRSFGQLVTAQEILEEAISNFVVRGAEKMRRQGSRAQGICVFIRTNPFREQDSQYSNSYTIGFPVPCSDTGQLIAYAKAGLKEIFKEGYLYKKAGVLLLDLVPSTLEQGHFFVSTETTRSDRVMQAVDALNNRMGKGTVYFAAQGRNQAWQALSSLRSPRYTTQWNELLRLN